MAETNSLLATSKSADTLLSVQLHPLVILTVSDYVTRHTLRNQSGPVVGAIIGAQNGREITMEHAFECKLTEGKDGDVLIDDAWFRERLKDFKDVHKIPPLDFVGWFTLAPPLGPQPSMLPIHHQLMDNYNESALLMTFTPSSVNINSAPKPGERLPFTIYETMYEAAGEGDDKVMRGQGDVGSQLHLRFKELPYIVETGEAEMISVDFVARGAANASAAPADASFTKSKGKAKDKDSEDTLADSNVLSTEEEETVASLTAKANAVRMLHQRIGLIKAYLQSLPPCYLNDASIQTCEPHPHISHPVLRSISSLLARLPLLTPAAPETSNRANGAIAANGDGLEPLAPLSTFESEAAAERTDVALTSLLGSLGKTLQQAQEMGRKAKVFEENRGTKADRAMALATSNGNMMGPPMMQGEDAYFGFS